jgi:hypothetical protein
MCSIRIPADMSQNDGIAFSMSGSCLDFVPLAIMDSVLWVLLLDVGICSSLSPPLLSLPGLPLCSPAGLN